MKVAVIGGGAAGFFTAINIREKCPDAEVVILEKTEKTLEKVRISGGGRCNVTNGRTKPGELVRFYPRGGKKLYKLFEEFGTAEMRAWLESRGVRTKVEADFRAFPLADDSSAIIDCFWREIRRLGVEVRFKFDVLGIRLSDEQWEISSRQEVIMADKVVFCTGASPKFGKLLGGLGFQINDPVPSLFTFHIKDERLAGLQGISFPVVRIRVAGTKLAELGPLLITHWGLSGPAVLKLSAWGARELHHSGYKFQLVLNFIDRSADQCREQIVKFRDDNPSRKVLNSNLFELPRRLWERLLELRNLQSKKMQDLGKSDINWLTEQLTQGHFQVTGKNAFKEEFVTCGGVDLQEIDLTRMEARRFPGLFFAGEVLDIDALTGGFNFQACWSAGWRISEVVRAPG